MNLQCCLYLDGPPEDELWLWLWLLFSLSWTPPYAWQGLSRSLPPLRWLYLQSDCIVTAIIIPTSEVGVFLAIKYLPDVAIHLKKIWTSLLCLGEGRDPGDHPLYSVLHSQFGREPSGRPGLHSSSGYTSWVSPGMEVTTARQRLPLSPVLSSDSRFFFSVTLPSFISYSPRSCCPWRWWVQA
jgi:hypothetical protein